MNGARVLADDEDMGELGSEVLAAMGDQRAVVYGWVLKGCAERTLARPSPDVNPRGPDSHNWS